MAEERASESVSVQRSVLLEVLAVGILVAFGVHLLGSEVFEYLKRYEWMPLSLGILCVAAAFFYLGREALLRLNTSSEYEAIFLVEDKNKVIKIPRYEFSEKLARFVEGLCAENPAIAKLWQTPLSRWIADNASPDQHKDLPSKQLLIEAVEYFLLDQLSLHLSGHFGNNENVSNDELISLSATDIPGVLLKNRFLSAFSRSMEERVAFMHISDKPPVGDVVFATGENGAIYDAFELILPRGTTVERTGSGALHIKTERFTLSVVVGFDGFNGLIDNEMADYYIKRQPNSFHTYEVKLNLSIRLKPLSMLFPAGWEYYRWRETFITRLEEAFSFERFKRDIGWETARTFAILRSVTTSPTTNHDQNESETKKAHFSIVKVDTDAPHS